MRNLFAVPWLTLSYRTVVTILAAVAAMELHFYPSSCFAPAVGLSESKRER